jgi:hypothetical protein
MHYALLALEFDAGALDEQVPVRFVFEAENTEHWDFTRTLQAPLRAGQEGPTRIYFPLYYGPDTRFVGLELPATQWARLQAVYRVDTTARNTAVDDAGSAAGLGSVTPVSGAYALKRAAYAVASSLAWAASRCAAASLASFSSQALARASRRFQRR